MKILLFDFNNVLADVAKELVARGNELLEHDGKKSTWMKADVIVVWNETELGGWRDWIIDVKKKGKRVVLMQHGRRGTSRIFPPFNETLVSDVICSWGENDRKRMESCGVPSEKIVVTGTTVLRKIKPRIQHEGINVVFSPEHWDIDVAENAIIASQLRKIPGVKIITKTLIGEHDQYGYDNPVASDRKMEGHLETCVEVLQQADVVVAVSESTFELMAEIMDIPVVIADIWVPKACNGDERYRDYHREYSDACKRVKNVQDLPKEILKTLKNPKELQKERKEIGILDGGIHIENPLEEIIKVIENK